MSIFLIFAFSSQGGATQMIPDLLSLQGRQAIKISDGAVVIRKLDGKIGIQPAKKLSESRTLGDAFWGVLVGMVFFTPWMGMASGTASGALAGKSSDYGISPSFIKETGAAIQPGYSSLFLLVSHFTEEEVIKVLSMHRGTYIRADLNPEDEVKLRDAFGVVDVEL